MSLPCSQYHLVRDNTLQQITDNGGSGRIVQFDISNRQQCRDVIEADIEAHGAYYGVINNAGITRDAAFPALTDEDWDGVIHTNLDSFYNVLQPCVMPMIGLRQGGRIIALSSVSGITGNRGQVNYSAAKAGIIGACKALSLELAHPWTGQHLRIEAPPGSEWRRWPGLEG